MGMSSVASCTGIDVSRARIEARMLSCLADRCWTRTKAMPVSEGRLRSSWLRASSPPAEAPTPTTGNRFRGACTSVGFTASGWPLVGELATCGVSFGRAGFGRSPFGRDVGLRFDGGARPLLPMVPLVEDTPRRGGCLASVAARAERVRLLAPVDQAVAARGVIELGGASAPLVAQVVGLDGLEHPGRV